MMKITAQTLYDLRDETEMIDGTGLHALFTFLCGEPSPRGATLVDTRKLAANDESWSLVYRQFVRLAEQRG